MHVCFASLDYPDEKGGGGVGTYVQIIGRELVRQGHRVSVVALKRDNALSDVTDDKGVKVYRTRPGNIHWYVSKLPLIGTILALPIRELEYSSAVLKTVREIDGKAPVYIVEGTETGTYCFRRLRPGIKTVIRLHGERYTFAKYTPQGKIPSDVILSRLLQRTALKKAHCLTSPSECHAREVASEIGVSQNQIFVVPNPLDSDLLDKSERKPEKDPVFLFMGRLERRKGIIEILHACPKILEISPLATFLFAGNSHPSIKRETMENLIGNFGIKNNVRFLGHLERRELEYYLSRATAAVLPSYYETFGYAYLEALMHGLPVVAFDSGSAKDFIVDGKNGFLVPAGDVDALAVACVAAIDLRMSMPEKGDFSKYVPEQVCKEMISIYENLLCND